jgi:hypothetical protein
MCNLGSNFVCLARMCTFQRAQQVTGAFVANLFPCTAPYGRTISPTRQGPSSPHPANSPSGSYTEILEVNVWWSSTRPNRNRCRRSHAQMEHHNLTWRRVKLQVRGRSRRASRGSRFIIRIQSFSWSTVRNIATVRTGVDTGRASP